MANGLLKQIRRIGTGAALRQRRGFVSYLLRWLAMKICAVAGHDHAHSYGWHYPLDGNSPFYADMRYCRRCGGWSLWRLPPPRTDDPKIKNVLNWPPNAAVR